MNGYTDAALAGYYEPGPDPCETYTPVVTVNGTPSVVTLYPTRPEGITSAADQRHAALAQRVAELEQQVAGLRIQVGTLRSAQATCGCDCTRAMHSFVETVSDLAQRIARLEAQRHA